MIQSVIVYGFMIACFWQLGTTAGKVQFRNPRVKLWSPEIWMILIIFAFFCGVRNNVGVDWASYKDSYVNYLYEDSTRQIEWLYYQFVFLMSDLGIHYSVYFAFVAFLQLYFILKAFEDERFIYPFLLFVFMTNESFFMWMNAMRQCLVISIFIYSIKFIEKRELIKYLIAIVISSFIHKSAVLLFPFYLSFFSKDLFKSKTLQYSLLVVAITLVNLNIWEYFMNYIDNIATILGFGEENRNVVDRFSLYEDVHHSIGPRFIATVGIGAICIFFSDRIKKSFNLNFFYNFFYIGLLSYIIFYNAPLLSRATMYFTYLMFITIAYTLYYLKLKNNINLNQIAFLILIGALGAYLLATIRSNWYTQYYFLWQDAGPIGL